MDVQGELAGKEAEVGTMTGEEAGNVTEDVAHANIKAPNRRSTETRGETGSLKSNRGCG